MSYLTEFQETLNRSKSLKAELLRYGVATVLVALALFLSLLLQKALPDAFWTLFFAAVMSAGWFCRTGPGILASILSIGAADYYFVHPLHQIDLKLDELPYFGLFLFGAIVSSWLNSARTEEEEKQKAHLDELFEQAPEAIMLLDLDDNILRINKEFTHIFGYRPEDVVGRRGTAIIVPYDLRPEAIEVRDKLARGEQVSQETVRMKMDGERLQVSELAVPIFVGGKRIADYVIFRDISGKKSAEEALASAQRELAHLSRVTTMGELLASIAHEVNQPIGAIVTNGNAALRWLAMTPPELGEVRESIEWIIRDANRASDVIGRIRALLEKNAPQMQSVNLNEVVRSVIVFLEHELRQGDVALETKLDPRLPNIHGDRIQLQQVILNLMMNGIDAMNSVKGRLRQLRITSSAGTGGALLTVEDSGIGLTDDTLERIFNPFFTTKPKGLGMGLSISRSIIESHGGRLWASPGAAHGAVFQFTLPIPEREL